MTITEGVSLLNSNIVAVGAACLGLGAALGKIKSYVGRVWDWLNGTQGRQATKEIQGLLVHIANLAEIAGHPEPVEVRKTLDGIVAQLPGADPVIPGPPIGPKAAGFVLALFLAASLSASTTYDLSLGSPLGSGAWEVVDGGRIVSAGSTLAGVGLSLSYGSLEADKYTPYIAILGGFGGETRNGDNYLIGFLGVGPIIPGTSVPLIIGPDWRFFTGQQYPAIMASTSIQWGQSLWRSK